MSNNVEKADGKQESWWQRNWRKLFLIGGCIIIGGVVFFVFYKKRGFSSALTLNNQPLPLQTPVQQISKTLPSAPAVTAVPEALQPVQNSLGRVIQVNGFVRKLPTGWSASEKQRQLAATLDVVLGEGETYVSPFGRTLCA